MKDTSTSPETDRASSVVSFFVQTRFDEEHVHTRGGYLLLSARAPTRRRNLSPQSEELSFQTTFRPASSAATGGGPHLELIAADATQHEEPGGGAEWSCQ